MQRVLRDFHRGEHGTVYIFPEKFDVVLKAFEVLGRNDDLDDGLLFLAAWSNLDQLFLLVRGERILDRLQRAGFVVLNHLFSI